MPIWRTDEDATVRRILGMQSGGWELKETYFVADITVLNFWVSVLHCGSAC
jgi:hypothetical protein